jgi:hypothetical protein
MGKIVEIKDVVDAVLYLAQAGQVTGDVHITWMVVLTLDVGSRQTAQRAHCFHATGSKSLI